MNTINYLISMQNYNIPQQKSVGEDFFNFYLNELLKKNSKFLKWWVKNGNVNVSKNNYYTGNLRNFKKTFFLKLKENKLTEKKIDSIKKKYNYNDNQLFKIFINNAISYTFGNNLNNMKKYKHFGGDTILPTAALKPKNEGMDGKPCEEEPPGTRVYVTNFKQHSVFKITNFATPEAIDEENILPSSPQNLFDELKKKKQ